MSSSFSTSFFLFTILFLSLSLVSSFTIDCEQSRVAGRVLTDPNNFDSGDLVFDFYRNPTDGQNQLLSVAGGVNTWTMNETITNGALQFDIFPADDTTPGMYPQLAVSLNGNYLINPQTNNSIWNTYDVELPLSFTSGFLGDGSADTPNEITLNVFAYYYMNGYSTCSTSYKFNITNPANP